MISFTFAQYPKRDFPLLFCRRIKRIDLTQPEDGRLGRVLNNTNSRLPVY